jgi:hypothetical protein
MISGLGWGSDQINRLDDELLTRFLAFHEQRLPVGPLADRAQACVPLHAVVPLSPSQQINETLEQITSVRTH